MSAMDPYGTTNQLNETVLQAIVTRLEARGNHPFFARMLYEYLDAMQIDAAHTVLDIGCGTGVVARKHHWQDLGPRTDHPGTHYMEKTLAMTATARSDESGR
jgi:2-polyprenyl-3-methyl-5-hydroxy-6-metoxy-1,4-benzoquinol methylase